MTDTPGATRTACVIQGSAPHQVTAVHASAGCTVHKNAVGTLVIGRFGDGVIDCAAMLPGPVYDVMYSPRTGWFSVTVYVGMAPPVRWDNRPDTDAGYARVPAILEATTPAAILAALDIPATAIGYVDA